MQRVTYCYNDKPLFTNWHASLVFVPSSIVCQKWRSFFFYAARPSSNLCLKGGSLFFFFNAAVKSTDFFFALHSAFFSMNLSVLVPSGWRTAIQSVVLALLKTPSSSYISCVDHNARATSFSLFFFLSFQVRHDTTQVWGIVAEVWHTHINDNR